MAHDFEVNKDIVGRMKTEKQKVAVWQYIPVFLGNIELNFQTIQRKRIDGNTEYRDVI